MEPAAPYRIGILEDDAALARLTARLLARQGYEVVVWPTCGALRQALPTAAECHLLLLDGTLPDGEGLEVVGEVTTVWPCVVCVLTSGAPPAEVPGEVVAVLAKPFTERVLLETVTALLPPR
ncbi:MAG: response regulator transcription factor [Fimbriimonadaceae bacterium]|nr:response regulator transcription factor [Fimbriimonadaceae bacterium]